MAVLKRLTGTALYSGRFDTYWDKRNAA